MAMIRPLREPRRRSMALNVTDQPASRQMYLGARWCNHSWVCCTSRWHLSWLAVMVSWEDVAVPKPYPQEFRDDVVRVARNREPGVTVEQIAKDFGVHPMTLFKWLRQADTDEGVKPGVSRNDSA